MLACQSFRPFVTLVKYVEIWQTCFSSLTVWLFPVITVLVLYVKNGFTIFQNRLFLVTSLITFLVISLMFIWTVSEDLGNSYVGACIQTNFQCFFFIELIY